MKRYLLVLLTAVLASGCASASVTSFPAENQEEQIQKLLVGTWAGYMKDTRFTRIRSNDRVPQIFEVRKEPSGWKISATLNRQSLQYINLIVYHDTVNIEMLDNYNALYILQPYRNTHLMGKAAYDRGRWMLPPDAAHDVVLKKISR